jgi:hypothetical protein
MIPKNLVYQTAIAKDLGLELFRYRFALGKEQNVIGAAGL